MADAGSIDLAAGLERNRQGESSPWREVMELLAGPCDSLQSPHAAGAVQRDIQPDHVMLADTCGHEP